MLIRRDLQSRSPAPGHGVAANGAPFARHAIPDSGGRRDMVA